MKQDKFLIGIVIAIVLLIVVAVVTVLLRAPATESYRTGNAPADVVHNYFLAVQREDYEQAYGYLSDELESRPDFDEFIVAVDNNRTSETSLRIGEVTQPDNNRARVDVAITTYNAGPLFDSSSYTSEDTVLLRQDDTGAWKIVQFPHPYWGWNWNVTQD